MWSIRCNICSAKSFISLVHFDQFDLKVFRELVQWTKRGGILVPTQERPLFTSTPTPIFQTPNLKSVIYWFFFNFEAKVKQTKVWNEWNLLYYVFWNFLKLEYLY